MDMSVALYPEDSLLIQEYIHGDSERAAANFVRRYQRFVYTLALRQLNNSHDDAEDAAQEVFIRALRALKNFKGESALQTWLYRITVNVASSMRRKKKFSAMFRRSDSDDSFDLPSDGATPEQHLMSGDFLSQFMQLLDQLPERQRETFCLRYFDELNYEEISEILGTSVGGLKANYFHAIQKLAVLIKKSPLFEKGEFGYE